MQFMMPVARLAAGPSTMLRATSFASRSQHIFEAPARSHRSSRATSTLIYNQARKGLSELLNLNKK